MAKRRAPRRRKPANPLTYPLREVRRGLRQMKPWKVIWRGMSGPEFMAGLRSVFGTTTVHMNAKTRTRQVEAHRRKTEAAKKRSTRVIKPQPGAKTWVKRNAKGQWAGREAMPGYERSAYLAAYDRAETPPPAVRWTGTRTPRSSR